MKKALALTTLLVASTSAFALIGTLVNSSMVTTVSGMAAWKCVYQVGSQTFSQVIPVSQGPCPATVNVQ